MAYIGKQPTVGNFVKLDAITTSATATYNLLNGGVAYSPQSANHCIVSLNGVIQEPTSASNVGGFTISGSTIVFTSALTALDVIDFILVLGDVLNIGTPSDGTVGFAKVTSNLITGATAETSIAGGDSILIYDDSATALRKMTRTNFVSGLANTPAFEASTNAQSVTTEVLTKITAGTETFDTNSCYDNATNYRFTPTTAGKYFVYAQAHMEDLTSFNELFNCTLQIQKNGGGITNLTQAFISNNTTLSTTQPITVNCIVDMNGTTDYLEAFGYVDVNPDGPGNIKNSRFGAYRLIGV